MSDAIVNDQILTKYSLWDYLTPCDADNINILNSCINRWRDEANKLYDTTRLQYDPLHDYDMTEDGTDKRTPDLTDKRTPDLTDETSYGRTVTEAETGYDTPRVLEDTAKSTSGGKDTTTSKGTDTTTHTGTETKKHDLRKYGMTGAAQELIAKERQIILDCLSWYVDKFSQCFNVSMSVGDYDCPTPCDLEVFAEFSPCSDGDTVSKKLDTIDKEIGDLTTQLDVCCQSMGKNINDLKKSVADSKAELADAISGKGVETASDATFATMADNIRNISMGGVVQLSILSFDNGSMDRIEYHIEEA